MSDTINQIFASPLVSVLTGGGITWFFAWLYFKKAGDELEAEAAKLRKATNLILYCLAHPEAKVTPNYDEQGNVSGLTVNMAASLAGSGGLHAETSDAV